MALLKLTTPEGLSVWVVSAWVTKIQKPPLGQYDVRALALVWTGANVQAVRETTDVVVRMLEELDE